MNKLTGHTASRAWTAYTQKQLARTTANGVFIFIQLFSLKTNCYIYM